MNLTLRGGPHDGRTVEIGAPCATVVTLVAHGPKRHPTDTDKWTCDEYGVWQWVDPDLRITYEQHAYNARTGQYVGVQG